jgi:BASS family bile acid:Na+ symporter
MTAAKITILALQASIFLTVFCLGLEASLQDALSLFRRPGALLRALLAMNVVMPVFAAIMAAVSNLRPQVEVALILLAVSPVPPVLPRTQLKVARSSSYIYGLLVAVGLLSIAVVPVTIEILGRAFSADVHISSAAVARVVIMTILLPLGLGILVHARAPDFFLRHGKFLTRLSLIVLLIAAAPLLILAFPAMISALGNGTLVAIAAFILVGLAVGHWLGRPDPGEQTTLALATASRHPGLAMAIAAANFPAQSRQIAAAILLYFLVRMVVVIPYTRARKRFLDGEPSQPEDLSRVA